MKRIILLLAISIFVISNCQTQIVFEKGYFIGEDNHRVECQIKNVDWKNNPTEFKYRLSKNSESKKLASVKEFGVYNTSKFIRRTINIDRSSQNIGNLSHNKNPINIEEKLFLKVLIEGEASLYSYVDGPNVFYYYNTDNDKVEQLVFKSYRTKDNRIGTNNRFRQQLWNHLKCPLIRKDNVDKLDYTKRDLTKIFIEYNQCHNQEFTNFNKKKKRDLFKLSIRPGFNISDLSIVNTNSSYGSADFKNEVTFRFGLEFEFIMPFNKNKWAFLFEPTYQYFKSEKDLNVQRVTIDKKSIELPFGLRHYFFLSTKSKFFVNGLLIYNYNGSSVIDYTSKSVIPYNDDIFVGNRINFALGLGYKYNNRYGFEFRYHTSRALLQNHLDYRIFSAILGYSLY